MRYRNLVTIQRLDPNGSRDEYNVPQPGWVDVCQLWCAIEPLAGREYYAAAQTQAELTHRITARYRSDIVIQPTMRALYGSRVLEIIGVADVEERHRWLELRCVERVADGA